MTRREEITRNIALMLQTSPKTQAQIAQELGIDKATISDYNTGRNMPTILVLRDLCQALNCSYEDILGTLEKREQN